MYTQEEGKKRFEELGSPFSKIKAGTTIIVNGERKTLTGFIGCPSFEAMTIPNPNYNGCGVPWTHVEGNVKLEDSFYQNIDFNLGIYSDDTPQWFIESEEKIRMMKLDSLKRSEETERELRVIMLESRNPYSK